jgi:hypothetical protein
VSSFTVIKGAMIGETYAAFAGWDLSRSKRENLDRLRDHNYIGAKSDTWLRDVAKVLNRRFEPDGRDRALVILAQKGCATHEWKPILLWHITRDEFLLRDFLVNWLFPAFDEGAFRVRPDALLKYLEGLRARGGTTEHDWTESTADRVAAGLLKMATDFELLKGSVVREFAPYHLPERSFLYLLHALRDELENAGRLVSAPDWRMYLMRPADVERELLRLHQFRKLEYHAAGSLVQLTLPCASAHEYAESMAI